MTIRHNGQVIGHPQRRKPDLIEILSYCAPLVICLDMILYRAVVVPNNERGCVRNIVWIQYVKLVYTSRSEKGSILLPFRVKTMPL